MALQAVNPVHGAGSGLRQPRQASDIELMKEISKKQLRRKVYDHPELARKLVVVESSPVYNSKGELIPTLGFRV